MQLRFLVAKVARQHTLYLCLLKPTPRRTFSRTIHTYTFDPGKVVVTLVRNLDERDLCIGTSGLNSVSTKVLDCRRLGFSPHSNGLASSQPSAFR
jgi:hypothetical protein